MSTHNARDLSTATQRHAPKTCRTPTGLVSLAEYLAYVEYCAAEWDRLGRKHDAEELRKMGYELLQEIEASE